MNIEAIQHFQELSYTYFLMKCELSEIQKYRRKKLSFLLNGKTWLKTFLTFAGGKKPHWDENVWTQLQGLLEAVPFNYARHITQYTRST